MTDTIGIRKDMLGLIYITIMLLRTEQTVLISQISVLTLHYFIGAVDDTVGNTESSPCFKL